MYLFFLAKNTNICYYIYRGDVMKKRIILHIDVNNAFLSWSAVNMLNNGYQVDIRHRFAVIGGDESQRKGIVLAKSIPAKRMGVVTGESLYMARTKCPNLEVFAPDFKTYKKYSDMMYEYLLTYSDKVERYSIDECFIDYTDSLSLFGDPVKIAYKIKEDIKEKFGFTVNVGVGENKLCAKMASDFTKPDKVHTLFMSEVKDKTWGLSVSDLFMIGKKTSEKLIALGINTIGDLANTDVDFLVKHFKSMGYLMHDYANGIDSSSVEYESVSPKSISASTVLPYDYDDSKAIKNVIRELSIDVGDKLRRQGFNASVVFVSIKYSDFSKFSKQYKLDRGINSDNDLYNSFSSLFDKLWNGKAIRNICVGVTSFSSSYKFQLSLFDDNHKVETESGVQAVVDSLRKRFGNDKVIYGDMLKKK